MNDVLFVSVLCAVDHFLISSEYQFLLCESSLCEMYSCKFKYNIVYAQKHQIAYLNMKINNISNEKNIATLSMVLNITNSCLLRLGMNLTNFSIRKSRNVLKTESPESP